jgi:uncharacterized membrane protein YphA (DoxX/SURF4 family)
MQSDLQTTPASKAALWTGRVMSALPVLMLILSGSMKLIKPAAVVDGFAHLGWPEHLALPLGIIELTCTLLYVIPRTSVLGAILITGYLGGATATHARLGEPWFAPVLLGMLAWGGLFMRDTRVRDLIPLRK